METIKHQRFGSIVTVTTLIVVIVPHPVTMMDRAWDDAMMGGAIGFGRKGALDVGDD